MMLDSPSAFFAPTPIPNYQPFSGRSFTDDLWIPIVRENHEQGRKGKGKWLSKESRHVNFLYLDKGRFKPPQMDMQNIFMY